MLDGQTVTENILVLKTNLNSLCSQKQATQQAAACSLIRRAHYTIKPSFQ